MCRKIKIEEINDVIKILHQESLRYADGSYPEELWIKNFFNKKRGYILGYYKENVLVAVLIAESLLDGGTMLWYIAVSPENKRKGYGGILLEYFEKVAKSRNRTWIFLNATPDSVDFYKKKGFVTNESAKVFEHFKEIL